MSVLLVFALAAAGTYVFRSLVMFAGARQTSTGRFAGSLDLVGPSALAALITSAVVLDHGDLATPSLAKCAAVVAAFVAVRRTSNNSAALAVGSPTFWLLTALGTG